MRDSSFALFCFSQASHSRTDAARRLAESVASKHGPLWVIWPRPVRDISRTIAEECCNPPIRAWATSKARGSLPSGRRPSAALIAATIRSASSRPFNILRDSCCHPGIQSGWSLFPARNTLVKTQGAPTRAVNVSLESWMSLNKTSLCRDSSTCWSAGRKDSVLLICSASAVIRAAPARSSSTMISNEYMRSRTDGSNLCELRSAALCSLRLSSDRR